MELRIEKINVSDDKFLVTTLYVHSGDKVSKGDLIYSVESSKAAMDVEAPCDGYIFFAEGVEEFNEYPANYLLAQIVDTDENPFESTVVEEIIKEKESFSEVSTLTDVVVTEEAKLLMSRYDVNISEFRESFISKWDVLNCLQRREEGLYGSQSTLKRVAIIGAGHAAIQVLDLISHIDQFIAVALYDDTPEKQNISLFGVPVVGMVDFLKIKKDYSEGKFDYIVNSVGASIPFREKCFNELTKLGVPYCNLIHPTAVIGQNVSMGQGNILYALSHIGPNVTIGNDNYITAQTSIEHHNIIGNHCTFGPGVKTSGTVTIGDCTRFAAGIFVEPYINIGSDCIIASGVIITRNIPNKVVVRNKSSIEMVENRL